MESTNSFDLDAAIGQYISQVDSAEILSEEEKDQIYDHFRNEAASLQGSGLNTEESFFVAKMRFGDSSTIQKEFARVKPWNSFLQIISIAVVLVMGIKLILNVAQAISFLVVLALKELSNNSIKAYLNIGDWIVQGFLITILFYLGYSLVKVRVKHIKHLWPIPVMFILSEGISRIVLYTIFNDRDFTAKSTLYESSDGYIFYLNSVYIYAIVIGATIIASLWVIYRNRNQRIEFA